MVSSDDPDPKQSWDPERHETETERLDRNWSSLLQELRVTQTGVQLLTGFLLTLPFSDGFEEVNDSMRAVYLATIACSICSTVLLIAPVSMHRMLFRRHRLGILVATAHRYALAGLFLLGLAVAGVSTLIFGVVLSDAAGWIAGAVTLGALAVFWFLHPVRERLTGRGTPPGL